MRSPIWGIGGGVVGIDKGEPVRTGRTGNHPFMNERHFAYWPKRRPREFPVPATSVAHNLATSAARYPEHPAIVYYDTPIAYRRLWDEVERLAGYLEHRAGVPRGGRGPLCM